MMAKKNNKQAGGGDGDGSKLIMKNRRAFHDYEVLDKLECGLVLQGTEVKSLRDGHVSFADCYATVRDNELWLIGLNISEYAMGNRMNHQVDSNRKLLAHKREIKKLRQQVQQKGFTLVPLDLHWRRGLAKVTLGVVRGKAQYDKRQSLKDRETQRERARALRRG